jgi:DNA-binding GntR family transcriptional regulator
VTALPTDDPPVKFGALEAGSLVDQVLTQLREAILRGQVSPGQPLHESTVAADMGISRAPVREALRLLQQAGLVTKSTNHPYFVTVFEPADIEDIACLRIGLETLAARLVVRRKPDPSPLLGALGRLTEAVASEDQLLIVRADREFHDVLVGLSGARRLANAYKVLRDQMELAMMTSDAVGRGLDGLVERHEGLVRTMTDAFVSGDPAQLVSDLEVHIADGMDVDLPI